MSERSISVRAALALIFIAAFALVPYAAAETMVEYSSEARFQLDLHVPDAVLNSFCRRVGCRTSLRRALQRTRIYARSSLIV